MYQIYLMDSDKAANPHYQIPVTSLLQAKNLKHHTIIGNSMKYKFSWTEPMKFLWFTD